MRARAARAGPVERASARGRRRAGVGSTPRRSRTTRASHSGRRSRSTERHDAAPRDVGERLETARFSQGSRGLAAQPRRRLARELGLTVVEYELDRGLRAERRRSVGIGIDRRLERRLGHVRTILAHPVTCARDHAAHRDQRAHAMARGEDARGHGAQRRPDDHRCRRPPGEGRLDLRDVALDAGVGIVTRQLGHDHLAAAGLEQRNEDDASARGWCRHRGSARPARAQSRAPDAGPASSAGEPGFEPGFTVLETVRVAIDSLPRSAGKSRCGRRDSNPQAHASTRT